MAPFSAAASVDDVLLILHWRLVVYSKLGDDHDIQELYLYIYILCCSKIKVLAGLRSTPFHRIFHQKRKSKTPP